MEDEVEDIFDPTKGNVVFGCAFDGWAFRVQQFAKMYAQKLGASASALTQGLWGEFYYHPKAKTVSKGKPGAVGKGKPMFVQFILEPIWNVSNLLSIVDNDFSSNLHDGPRNLQCNTKCICCCPPRTISRERYEVVIWLFLPA